MASQCGLSDWFAQASACRNKDSRAWRLTTPGTLEETESSERYPVVREEAAMPQRAWSDKRERQYDHIKEGLRQRGEGEDTAEEIAARTVNKERARAGEAKQASRTSIEDISSGRRGGLRSHSGSGARTKD